MTGVGPPTLVLLSGMLGDASLWDDLRAGLGRDVTTRPIRLDRDATIDNLAGRVLAEAPASFALCGHSLGGIVALEVALRAPQRVTQLALVASSGRAPSPVQRAAWSELRRRTLAGDFAQVAGELARATLAEDRRDDADLVARNLAMASTVGPEGFLRQLAAQESRRDLLADASRLAMDVLVLSGSADGVCPPELQAELAQRCPRAEVVTVDSGHTVPLEAPDDLLALMRPRLAGTLAGQ